MIWFVLYVLYAAIQSKLFTDAVAEFDHNAFNNKKSFYVIAFLLAPIVTIAVIADFINEDTFRKEVFSWFKKKIN